MKFYILAISLFGAAISACSPDAQAPTETDDQVREQITVALQEMDQFEREYWAVTCRTLAQDRRVGDIIGSEAQARILAKADARLQAVRVLATQASRAQADVDGMMIRGGEMVSLRARECDLGLE